MTSPRFPLDRLRAHAEFQARGADYALPPGALLALVEAVEAAQALADAMAQDYLETGSVPAERVERAHKGVRAALAPFVEQP